MAWIRVKSVLIKEISIEDAKAIVDDVEAFGEQVALSEIGNELASSLDLEVDEIELEILDDDGRDLM